MMGADLEAERALIFAFAEANHDWLAALAWRRFCRNARGAVLVSWQELKRAMEPGVTVRMRCDWYALRPSDDIPDPLRDMTALYDPRKQFVLVVADETSIKHSAASGELTGLDGLRHAYVMGPPGRLTPPDAEARRLGGLN